MRGHQIRQALEPMQGMLLHRIEDSERQQAMDQTLQVIQGWQFQGVLEGQVESPDHPTRITNTHLVFADGGGMPTFNLSVYARDVHRVDLRDVQDNGGTARKRVEFLFKRGHRVTLELV